MLKNLVLISIILIFTACTQRNANNTIHTTNGILDIIQKVKVLK